MKHHIVKRFTFEPVAGRVQEMIETQIAYALSDLSRENRRAMKPTSITFQTIAGETYMVLVADPVASDYDRAIVDAIRRIEHTINPPITTH